MILEEVDSTNTYLLHRFPAEVQDGTVVAAEHQTAGKGRQGRVWVCPPGKGLLFSVYLKTGPIPAGLATLAGAVSAVGGLRMVGVEAKLKWPNDMVGSISESVEEKKIGGVLCETLQTSEGKALVLGIGLNVNVAPEEFPPDLRGQATSAFALTGKMVDRNRLLAIVLEELDHGIEQLESGNSLPLIEEVRSICSTLGHLIRVRIGDREVEGVAEDVDSRGRLILRLESGAHRVLELGEIKETRRID